ncbi:transposon-encoded TnpW family protein [Christensenellaceae bacterium OttesenSCG-928-M15]|nr:transposon-encoded TnpW family protein [Christensenellaceae bacterium OttesenSCG-928-M15]
MDNSNESNNGKLPGASGQSPLEDTRTYTVQGKTFVVEPVFKEGAKETVGTVLLRLIQSDVETP